MEDNKKNVLNNQPNNEENKRKNKLLAWWLGLGKWAKVGVCAGATAVLASAVIFPTLAATVWNKGGDTYKIDWNTTKHEELDNLTLHDYFATKNICFVNFIESDSLDGIHCGETANDKVYFRLSESFNTNRGYPSIIVWAKKAIVFEDNDRGTDNKGFFERSTLNADLGRGFGLSNVDTSKVTNMERMFYNCSLKGDSGGYELDLSNVNTSNVVKMKEMFKKTNQDTDYAWLKSIIVDSNKFKTNKVLGAGGDNGTDMFANRNNLKGGKNTACDGTNNIDANRAKVDGGVGNEGYFTEKTA